MLMSLFSFQEGDIAHEHDSNPRIGTWRCKNGHEFQIRGKKPCLGCGLERSRARQEAERNATQTNRMRSCGSGGNDHHRDNFNSGPGPALL